MKRHFLFIVGLLFSIQVIAQTGIGTAAPNASAKLDVYADNKGFLPPRVTLTSATDNTTVPNAAEGLLVYNKGSVGLQAGYYYWNGSSWVRLEDNSLTKVSALVGRGTDVTLGNLKVRMASSGNASLQVSTVSGTYSVYGSSYYAAGGMGYANILTGSPVSVTTTPTYLYSSLHYSSGGYRDEWVIVS